jgi:hypothetical protein
MPDAYGVFVGKSFRTLGLKPEPTIGSICHDLKVLCYMLKEGHALVGQSRSLAKIKRDRLREFQKPKSKLQCITEIKRIKQQFGETMWDYDQRFKILFDRLTFRIEDVQHREWFIAGLLTHIRVPLI